MANRLGYHMGIRNRNDEWPILYIDLPTGQVSWHLPSQELVKNFPDYMGEWDGHDVVEKHIRLMRFIEGFK